MGKFVISEAKNGFKFNLVAGTGKLSHQVRFTNLSPPLKRALHRLPQMHLLQRLKTRP